jgi:sugar-specific transcriptional regulator TrmB
VLEEKLSSLLSLFGLEEGEGKLYLFILREGNKSAGECARFLGITRMEAYRILRSMEEKGAVFSIPGRPVRYEAEPLEVLTSSSMERAVSLVKKMEVAREELISIVPRLPRTSERVQERFRIIQGREHIYSTVRRMASSSSEKLSMILTKNDVAQLYIAGFFDILSKKNSFNARLITSIEENTYDIVSEIVGKIDVRHSSVAESGRLVISDGRSVITSLVLDSSPGLRNDRDVAISVESRDYARMMDSLFEISFSGSVNSSERLSSLKAIKDAGSKVETLVSVLKAVSNERGWEIQSPFHFEGEEGRRLYFTFMLSSHGKRIYGDVAISSSGKEVREIVFATIAKKIQIRDAEVILVIHPYDEETARLCSTFGIKTFNGSDPVTAVSSIRKIITGFHST